MPARRRPSRPVRVATAVLATGGLVAGLSACATGFDAETNREYAAAVGNNSFDGDIDVLNALYVTNPDGTATLSAGLLDRVGSGDRLTGVSVDADGVRAALEGPVRLVRGTTFQAGVEEPEVVLDGDLTPGQDIATTFTFADAGDIVVQVPVVERTAMYREVTAPSIVPETTEPTDEPSDEPSVEPSDEPTS